MLLFHLLVKILQDPMYIPMWMVLNSDHTGSHQDFRAERHPADELIDNPTAVFFFLDFFFKQRTKGIHSEIRIRTSSRHQGRR